MRERENRWNTRFNGFDHSPRLMVLSPASGRGKSMLLHFLELAGF
jgi:hypothetical protein